MVNWLVACLLALFVTVRCEREEQFKLSVDCSKYGNGNYVFGCNPHYWVCANSLQHELRCYGELVLDPDENRCNYREKVRLCTDPNLPRDQPYRALELFTCYDKPNGLYSTGFCDSFFYSCINGTKNDFPCPNQQVFDNSTKKCDLREVVDECKPGNLRPRPLATPAVSIKSQGSSKVPSKPDESPRPLPKILPSGSKMSISAPLSTINFANQTASAGNPTQPETVIDCSQLPDGSYEVDKGVCSNKFWKCGNKLASYYQCPPGLFFNVDNKQCDFVENVVACGGTSGVRSKAGSADDIFGTGRDAPLLPVTTTNKPMADFNCTGKVDGFYIERGCQSSYVKCTGGKVEQKTCPQGQLLDPFVADCRPKEECGATTRVPRNGIAPSPLEHGNFDYYSQQANPPMSTFNCQGRADGFYELGSCQKNYVRCISNQAISHECPMDLVFFNNICDHVQRCLNPSAFTPAPLLSLQSLGQDSSRIADVQYYGQQQQYDTTTTPPDPWCRQNNKPDGFHGVGCAPYFYSCTLGFSTKIPCPDGLFYSPDDHQCENRDFIPACGGKKPETTTPPPMDAPRYTTPKDVWCQHFNMPDGIHGLKGCKNYYYSCNGGFSIRINCPSGLFYDYELQQCSHREWIPDCGGTRPLPTTTVPPHLNPTTPASTYCRDHKLSDGLHGAGCNNFFYACNGGFSTRLTCPGNLYFDETEQHCTNQEWIVACGGQKPTTLPPQLNPTMPTTPPDTWCRQNNKPDGLHGLGCANYFYACNGGFSTRLTCPGNLYFDETEQQCTNKEWIVACGGQKPTTLPPQLNPPMPTTPPDTWCQQNRKPDGFHGLGCANYFYNCNSGFSLRINCPSGLFYDPETHECNNRAFIPACGGKKPETTTPPPMDAPRYTTPKDVWCQHFNMPDGIHGLKGCKNYYYSCNGGFSIRINCPSGLFYDYELQQCSHREWIPDCGGSRPLPTTTVPPQLNPTTPADTYCRDHKLSDGLHGAGCNNFFYACNGEVSTRISCPSGLYFDSQFHECTNRAWIAACGGQRPTTTTTAQPMFNPTTADPWCRINQKPDGFHGEKCNSYFYSCSAGTTTKISCPDGLFYDVDEHQCNNRNLIVACGGKKPAPMARAPQMSYQPRMIAPSSPQQSPYAQQPVAMPQQSPPQPPSSNYASVQQSGPRNAVALNVPPESLPLTPDNGRNPCAKLPNGIYGRRCSRHFFVCTNHSTVDFICPNNQAYDARVNKCADKSQITTCASAYGPNTRYY